MQKRMTNPFSAPIQSPHPHSTLRPVPKVTAASDEVGPDDVRTGVN